MKEQQQIEWKESWRDDALRTICGFANADGGVLVIGRNDRGHIAGIDNGPRLLDGCRTRSATFSASWSM
jgi:ATP-dependent DNA helicase RecG